MLNIKIILGSTRPGRFSKHAGDYALKEAEKREGINAELLDLRDYNLPFYDQPISPAAVKSGEYGNEVAKKWAKKIAEADAYIMVTPEYNHSTSAVLKNAMDSIYAEWNKKPVGFISYGGVGGARAVEQLRLISIELQMAPIRSSININAPWSLVDDKNNLKEMALEKYNKNFDSFLDQLIWWGNALKIAREQN